MELTPKIQVITDRMAETLEGYSTPDRNLFMRSVAAPIVCLISAEAIATLGIVHHAFQAVKQALLCTAKSLRLPVRDAMTLQQIFACHVTPLNAALAVVLTAPWSAITNRDRADLIRQIATTIIGEKTITTTHPIRQFITRHPWAIAATALGVCALVFGGQWAYGVNEQPVEEPVDQETQKLWEHAEHFCNRLGGVFEGKPSKFANCLLKYEDLPLVKEPSGIGDLKYEDFQDLTDCKIVQDKYSWLPDACKSLVWRDQRTLDLMNIRIGGRGTGINDYEFARQIFNSREESCDTYREVFKQMASDLHVEKVGAQPECSNVSNLVRCAEIAKELGGCNSGGIPIEVYLDQYDYQSESPLASYFSGVQSIPAKLRERHRQAPLVSWWEKYTFCPGENL